jgi:uncharacterized protein (TIGR03032 family)
MNSSTMIEADPDTEFAVDPDTATSASELESTLEETRNVSPSPLRSVHSVSFPELLEQLGVSLLVSTYQAGKLVALRADGGVLNTHFRIFNKPMGVAVQGGRLAIGTAREVWEYHNLPAVAHKLDPVGKHDAAFLPRTCHVTGDIHIHEMAWAGDELWFVNTAFSCLCTRSDIYSFQPRWRPWFVTELLPADRCHLNGLALRDGRPRYVTALGETNENGGWRANKRDGGLLIDVERNEILARGLSMPHSPRWHNGRMWVLNSGEGGIGTIDPATGRYDEVTQLPGFTRGLSFYGPFAFIGLSQVRESAVFSGIPLVDRLAERNCGVWVVDLRSGEAIAFVKFEDAVQEIFAVEVLPGTRYPDVLNDDKERLDSSFELPDDAMADVPAPLRASVGKTNNDSQQPPR